MEENKSIQDQNQVKYTQEQENNVQENQPLDLRQLEYDIIQTLKTCYDPEIPVDIYELGLIYRIDIHPDGFVEIDMTLTSPMCPVAGTLPLEVERKVKDLPDVKDVVVRLVWEPMWTKDMMSDIAKIKLGFF